MKAPAHYQALERRLVARMAAGWRGRDGAPAKVLDYGCGQGTYLRVFRAAGLSVCGVDINPDYVASLCGEGFDVDEPRAFEQRGERFDVVFLSHLIEHLDPPALAQLMMSLCSRLVPEGRLVVVTPVLGERFYHDFTHVRPYTPQSLRHAFGRHDSPLSGGARGLIELVDIHFFRDPFRTRGWRTFYVGAPWARAAVARLNACFDLLWRATGGRIGTTASWLGVYRLLAPAGHNPGDVR